MSNENKIKQSRATTYFKFYSEKYLWGSTREEFTPAERSVWVDFLCLASINYGNVVIFSREHRAKQLNISKKLLDQSIDKFLKSNKVKRKYLKREKKEIFTITMWSRYQSDYLTKRQKKSTTYIGKKRSGEDANNDAEIEPILKKSKNDKEKYKYNEIDIHLSHLLFKKILQNNPKSKIQDMTENQMKDWYNECRLMRERDRRTPDEIESIIIWCQQDSFWKSNIRSMETLRRQFDQLWMKAQEDDPYSGIKSWLKDEDPFGG